MDGIARRKCGERGGKALRLTTWPGKLSGRLNFGVGLELV
jgi:hypothetical protein